MGNAMVYLCKTCYYYHTQYHQLPSIDTSSASNQVTHVIIVRNSPNFCNQIRHHDSARRPYELVVSSDVARGLIYSDEYGNKALPNVNLVTNILSLELSFFEAEIKISSFVWYVMYHVYIIFTYHTEDYQQWPLLLTWFNFNPSMDK